jgi:membrane protease YdiL (CAAX protease family)
MERTPDLTCPWCGYPQATRQLHWGIIVYLLVITAAETVTVFFAPLWGIISHIIIMVALILHSALASEHPHRQLVLSLALVPLVRIMSLSMPLSDIPQIWWYPIIYAPLVAAAVVVMRLAGYKAEDVGLTVKLLPIQLAIMLTGVLLAVAEYFILAPEPLVAEFTWPEIWLPALLLLVCTGFTEEFIFRGVLQRTAVEAFKGWGIVYVSFLFAILHMGFLSWIDVVFVFVVALFFGWVVKRTGSLLGVTLAHGLTNIGLYLVVPFLLG